MGIQQPEGLIYSCNLAGWYLVEVETEARFYSDFIVGFSVYCLHKFPRPALPPE